jgi:hypothetical protein
MDFYKTIISTLPLFLAGMLLVSASTLEQAKVESLSTSQLERRLSAINSELEILAHYSLRSGIGVIGYRSGSEGHRDRKEWIEVELSQEVPIDEVVLVPTIWRDSEKGFQPDGFPKAFKILAGTNSNREGSIIAQYDFTDDLAACRTYS